jgi:hypothetical protein
MNRLTTIAIVLAALALPAGAVAKPQESDKRAAIAQCKAERGKSDATREAFKAKYGSFSRCMRQNAVEEATERSAARANAAEQCRSERDDATFPTTHDGKTFEQFYGTNANLRNAYGKCVSTKARELKAVEDDQDAEEVAEFKSAAKLCAAERSDDGFAAEHGGKSFAEFYGTNENRRNAFGKCVSSKSDEDESEPKQDS